MDGLLDTGDGTTQINFSCLVVQVVDCRMGIVICTEHLFRLARLVWHPTVGNCHRTKDHTFLIPERDVLPDLKAVCKSFGHVQRDRHRPKRPINQPHVFDNAIVVLFAHKPFKRVEPAIHQEFQIANLAWRQIVAEQFSRFQLELLGAVIRDIKFRDWGKVLRVHYSAHCPNLGAGYASTGTEVQ